MNIIQQIETENLANRTAPCTVGDEVRVHVRIKDGDKSRIQVFEGTRSEERRVGKECRRLCRSRWSPYH
jgi:large subunit ribosomal protein L19